MQHDEYGKSDGAPPKRVTVDVDDHGRQTFTEQLGGDSVPAKTSEEERQFARQILDHGWPEGTHIISYGPGEQRMDGVVKK